MFDVTTKDRKTGLLTVIYGVGGTHKTTTIAEAIKNSEKGVFVSVGENGLSPLQSNNAYCDLSGITTLGKTIGLWDKEVLGDGTTKGEDGLLPLLRHLAKQDYKDIAIDSLTMIAPELEEYCFRKYYVNQNTKNKTEDELRATANGFGKSDILAYMAQEWSKFTGALRYLREEKGVNIYITAHTRVTKGRIIDEELEFDMLDLDLPSNKNTSLATPLYNMSDNFFCAMQKTMVLSGKKNTARLDGDVVFLTKSDAYRKCKSRCQVDSEIPATYESLSKLM